MAGKKSSSSWVVRVPNSLINAAFVERLTGGNEYCPKKKPLRSDKKTAEFMKAFAQNCLYNIVQENGKTQYAHSSIENIQDKEGFLSVVLQELEEIGASKYVKASLRDNEIYLTISEPETFKLNDILQVLAGYKSNINAERLR